MLVFLVGLFLFSCTVFVPRSVMGITFGREASALFKNITGLVTGSTPV